MIDGFKARPGSFSGGGPDAGSVLLASLFTDAHKGRAADLGAGWGWLSAQLLAKSPKIETLDLYESDAGALADASVNITDPRASFHWADVTRLSAQGGRKYDLVVSNPPFHTGRTGTPELGKRSFPSRRTCSPLPARRSLSPTATCPMKRRSKRDSDGGKRPQAATDGSSCSAPENHGVSVVNYC